MQINRKCFASHMGAWAVEPKQFSQTVSSVKAGLWPIRSAAEIKAASDYSARAVRDSYEAREGIALISLSGPMMKGASKFDGTADTLLVRQQIRDAASRDDVHGIMLIVDSPGGNVSGTKELADEVANAGKPVRAHIDDMGASAAYWVASQADKITANEPAEVGSLGVFAVVEDLSKAAEMQGIKVHVVSTGPYKGEFVAGSEVTPEQLAALRSQVEGINDIFQRAVASGRKMTLKDTAALFDGGVHLAKEALAKGLIDEVSSLDDAITSFQKKIKNVRKNKAASAAIDIAAKE